MLLVPPIVCLAHHRTNLFAMQHVGLGRLQRQLAPCHGQLWLRFHRLNLKRVLFVGDSLTFMQFQSLWKLLGLAGEPKHPWGQDDGTLIHCSTRDVRLLFVRNDRLSLDGTEKLCGQHPPKDVCLPWVPRYLESSDPTLLLFNTGIHMRPDDVYEEDLRALKHWAESRPQWRQQQDLPMFRTTVSGHCDCTGQRAPLIDASHFVPTPNFGWSRVPNLNQIASRVLTHNVQNSSMSEGILHAANLVFWTLNQ